MVRTVAICRLDPGVTTKAMSVRPVDTRGEARSASDTFLRLQILGPLRLWRDSLELEAGPPQQAYLLALLLAREGRPTSTAELVDLIWGEGAPASALNVIHKYIGALRRVLEPTLPARDTGSYLLRRGNGYMFKAGPETLDLVSFRELVAAAEVALAEHRQTVALDCYVNALGLWTGPAADGVSPEPAAMAIFAALNDQFYVACTEAADLAVSLRQPERVLTPLQMAAVMAPWHEPVQTSLITTLGAAGRKVEALSVFRAVRARLADDLGLDPGRALETAHRRVLSQDPIPEGAPPTVGAPPSQPVARRGTPVGGLVGRVEELALLRQVVVPAFADGAGLAIVEGEPGVGKTQYRSVSVNGLWRGVGVRVGASGRGRRV